MGEFIMNRKFPKEATEMKMYLQDLKERGAKIIIGEFYASSARQIMCAAYKEKMTQKEGYVWFLPGWFDDKWYDIDQLRITKNRTDAALRSRKRRIITEACLMLPNLPGEPSRCSRI